MQHGISRLGSSSLDPRPFGVQSNFESQPSSSSQQQQQQQQQQQPHQYGSIYTGGVGGGFVSSQSQSQSQSMHQHQQHQQQPHSQSHSQHHHQHHSHATQYSAPAFLLQDSVAHNDVQRRSSSSGYGAPSSSTMPIGGSTYGGAEPVAKYSQFNEEHRKSRATIDLSKTNEISDNPPIIGLSEIPSPEPVSLKTKTREMYSAKPSPFYPSLSLAEESTGSSEENCWITVFGFPLSLASLVLQQFELDGEIVQHETGLGNWMNIKFRLPLDAKKALGKNGKIITNSVMIGVLPTEKVNLRIPGPGEGTAHLEFSHRQKDYRPASGDYVLSRSSAVMKPPSESKGSLFSTITDYLFGW